MIKALSRPAQVLSPTIEIENEMRAARYIYHRLLDFELVSHQRVLEDCADRVAPGMRRVASIVARLRRRAARREKTPEGLWSPPTHPAWLAAATKRLGELRAQRNQSAEWRAALQWADTPSEDAPKRGGARRKLTESDEQFAVRCATRRTRLTRREAYRQSLYDLHVAKGATERSRIFHGTWNHLLKSVDRARRIVIQQRAEGRSASIRRPRWDDRVSIAVDRGGFRIVDRGGEIGNPWWTIEIRLHAGWARVRAKCGNWHAIPTGAKITTCILTYERGRYSISLTVDGMPDEHDYSVAPGRRALLDGHGVVALDWGHREHGHTNADMGLRVYTWLGSDSQRGEILLPKECRDNLDEHARIQSLLDEAYVSRKTTLGLHARNRVTYRAHLARRGVVSEEESAWLAWEMTHERRLNRLRRRVANIRRETYAKSVRHLRERYAFFVIEDVEMTRMRAVAKDQAAPHRGRQNRDLSAHYLFTQTCERFGAILTPVPARNTSRECPHCGHVGERSSDLMLCCTACGLARDRDAGACEVILRRGLGVLAERAPTQ